MRMYCIVMLTIIVYNVFMMNTKIHHITTTDSQRLRDWERIFGTAVLPVLHPRPRFITNEDGRLLPVFDLALNCLSQTQRQRLAAEIARRNRRGYGDVVRELNARPAYPIPARECEVVEDKTAQRPSFFMPYSQFNTTTLDGYATM